MNEEEVDRLVEAIGEVFTEDIYWNEIRSRVLDLVDQINEARECD